MAQGSGEMRQNVVECRACWGKGYKTKRRTSGFEHYFKMRAKVRESAARRSSLCKHLSVKAYLRICGRWKVVVGGTCVCKGKLKVNIGWFFEYRCQARSQQRRSFLMKLTELTDAHIYECFSGGKKGSDEWPCLPTIEVNKSWQIQLYLKENLHIYWFITSDIRHYSFNSF